MKAIVYTRPDGVLMVMRPVINTFGEAEGFTEEQAEQRAWSKLPVDAINPRFVVESEIPTDRTFRDAWADIATKISIDMTKARNIHLERIRIKRNAELSKLDIEAIKAQDMGDTEALTRIRARKQELRDLPATLAPALANAVTTDELKAIQPLI
jgi:hypothetical protein